MIFHVNSITKYLYTMLVTKNVQGQRNFVSLFSLLHPYHPYFFAILTHQHVYSLYKL